METAERSSTSCASSRTRCCRGSASAPAALAAVAMRPVREVRRQGIFWFGAIWFVAGYAWCRCRSRNSTTTSFPRIPGLAIAIACFLDDILDRRAGAHRGGPAIVGVRRAAVVTFDLVAAPRTARSTSSGCSRTTTSTPQGSPLARGARLPRPLIAFAIVVLRRHAASGLAPRPGRRPGGLGAVAVVFTFYLLDGYMAPAAPFWSQKHLIATYYKTRRSPDEKLLVWQMYWRGENFYTENEIYEARRPSGPSSSGTRTSRTSRTGSRSIAAGAPSCWSSAAAGQVPGMLPSRNPELAAHHRRQQHEVRAGPGRPVGWNPRWRRPHQGLPALRGIGHEHAAAKPRRAFSKDRR